MPADAVAIYTDDGSRFSLDQRSLSRITHSRVNRITESRRRFGNPYKRGEELYCYAAIYSTGNPKYSLPRASVCTSAQSMRDVATSMLSFNTDGIKDYCIFARVEKARRCRFAFEATFQRKLFRFMGADMRAL